MNHSMGIWTMLTLWHWININYRVALNIVLWHATTCDEQLLFQHLEIRFEHIRTLFTWSAGSKELKLGLSLEPRTFLPRSIRDLSRFQTGNECVGNVSRPTQTEYKFKSRLLIFLLCQTFRETLQNLMLFHVSTLLDTPMPIFLHMVMPWICFLVRSMLLHWWAVMSNEPGFFIFRFCFCGIWVILRQR